MCGITGIFAFNQLGKLHMINLPKATMALRHRGPDAGNTSLIENVGLGHRRLSIIDLSINAAQPMKGEDERYTLIFNGEIYNFVEIREVLQAKGYTFKSTSDTEVVLHAFVEYGPDCFEMFNGFFALAIYDKEKAELVLARDRYGIKPLMYYFDEDKFVFASELNSLLRFGVDRKIDVTSLYTYLQLNYLPVPQSMIKGVKSVSPGTYVKVTKGRVEAVAYYSLKNIVDETISFTDATKHLQELVEKAVLKRLVADVPLGTFLSGGVDSSIISGIAAKHNQHLRTFSIGYRDDPFFDETAYANLAAARFKTDHKVFRLGYHEMNETLTDVLNSMDQPFADSSAIPVYLLSKYTREEVTVALSGDGADELFSGYNKHSAHLRASHPNALVQFGGLISGIIKKLPQSRDSKISNKVRQFNRFYDAIDLDPANRYWQWASISSAEQAIQALSNEALCELDLDAFYDLQGNVFSLFRNNSINDVLAADQKLVLEGDMLRKVDLMSMANSLEVRVPFLDHNIVDFVNRLPASYKIDRSMRKRILQEAFKDLLPPKIYKRSKHGFEVPLLNWFRTSRFEWIFNDLLHPDKIDSDGILSSEYILRLKKQLVSKSPGDSHAKIYALVAFQWWYDHNIK